jgi:EAL domain-containing protein (putative c-di-GMP-specific phosphodiesterase class I)
VLLIIGILLAMAIPTFFVDDQDRRQDLGAGQSGDLTGADAYWTQSGQTYAGIDEPSTTVSNISAIDTNLSYVSGTNSTGLNSVSLWTDGSTSLVLAAYSTGARDCWYIIDLKAAATIWGASLGTGTYYAVDSGVDAALYEAKRQGKGRHVFFVPTIHYPSANRLELVQELSHSLSAGEVSMHYQPIVDLTTSEVVGLEALMRWQHPKRGQVPPEVFIPLAEKSDLIFELGSFALCEATIQARSWEQAGAQRRQPYVSVNLSARQFHDPELLSMIEKALTSSGLAPRRLVLEIQEAVALVDVVETRRVIERLCHYGVSVALDDFGTGCSSLSYLALLGPMIVKIDRSFVSPSKASISNDTLLEAIVSLGQRLDMTVAAEGIETQGQLERLRHLRCGLGQGYLFSPSVRPGEVANMLGRLPGNWGQRPAPPPSPDPPPFRSGADTPRSSDLAHSIRLDRRSGSPGAPDEAVWQPERRAQRAVAKRSQKCRPAMPAEVPPAGIAVCPVNTTSCRSMKEARARCSTTWSRSSRGADA